MHKIAPLRDHVNTVPGKNYEQSVKVFKRNSKGDPAVLPPAAVFSLRPKERAGRLAFPKPVLRRALFCAGSGLEIPAKSAKKAGFSCLSGMLSMSRPVPRCWKSTYLMGLSFFLCDALKEGSSL